MSARMRRRLCRSCRGSRMEMVSSVLPQQKEVQWCSECDGYGCIDEPSKPWIGPWRIDKRTRSVFHRSDLLTEVTEDGRVYHGEHFNTLSLAGGYCYGGGSMWTIRLSDEQRRWLALSEESP